MIHPIWAIDEKANIFFVFVWARPPIDPNIKDRSRVIIIIFEKFILIIRIVIGASFCQVNKMPNETQEILSAIDGTQKWKGAAPSLINKAILISSRGSIEKLFWIDESSRIEDLTAWIKKYFKLASIEKILNLLIIKGINPIIFISIPNQIGNQELALIEIIVPRVIIIIKGILAGFINI